MSNSVLHRADVSVSLTELHTGQMLVFHNVGQMSNSVSQCGTDVKQRYTLDRCQNDAATQRTYEYLCQMTQLHKGQMSNDAAAQCRRYFKVTYLSKNKCQNDAATQNRTDVKTTQLHT